MIFKTAEETSNTLILLIYLSDALIDTIYYISDNFTIILFLTIILFFSFFHFL